MWGQFAFEASVKLDLQYAHRLGLISTFEIGKYLLKKFLILKKFIMGRAKINKSISECHSNSLKRKVISYKLNRDWMIKNGTGLKIAQ